MPLLAYTQSGTPLIAPLLLDQDWEQLKATKDRDAWMPSGGRAIPKVSPLGTRFFAHPRGQTPPGGGESAPHLFLKAQCLVGAQAAGWEALPEQEAGRTPDGQPWRADVLGRRPGQPWSVALEAQVELQGEPAYQERQARYAAAGIRALWLVAHEPAALSGYWAQPDRALPAFRTRTWTDPQGRPAACVAVDGLSLSVADFIGGALLGQLHWYEQERHAIVVLILHEDLCWRRSCRRRVLLASGAETRRGRTVEITRIAELDSFAGAYARARAALPDLADSPQPYRRGLSSRCPQCGWEIRYPKRTWAPREDNRILVPIGIRMPEDVASRGISSLRPYAGWHWGAPARWSGWAPVGGIGRICREIVPSRATPDQLALFDRPPWGGPG
jgi:hypothetical protein